MGLSSAPQAKPLQFQATLMKLLTQLFRPPCLYSINLDVRLDELVDLLLRLALGVEVGVEVNGRHTGKEAKTGLLGCVLYRSCGSDEDT